MKKSQTIEREVRRLMQIYSELLRKGKITELTRDGLLMMRVALRWALDDGDEPINKRWMPPSSWALMWFDKEQREIVRRIMR